MYVEENLLVVGFGKLGVEPIEAGIHQHLGVCNLEVARVFKELVAGTESLEATRETMFRPEDEPVAAERACAVAGTEKGFGEKHVLGGQRGNFMHCVMHGRQETGEDRCRCGFCPRGLGLALLKKYTVSGESVESG